MRKLSRPTLELKREMGRAVIDHLSALGPLPCTGYLAGQSVSSAVFDLFADGGEGLMVYNDLDVFRPATAKDEFIADLKERTLSTVRYQGCQMVVTGYEHMGIEVTGSYSVVGSYREGLVNHVTYTGLGTGLTFHERPLLTLIKAFDLNVTQVGVDLATGELVWSPDFEAFWRSRQLLISNVQTPHHTAMRWFKKRQELPGAFGNDDAAMELVTLLNFAKGLKGGEERVERSNLRWRFGAKNAGMYEQYQHQLAPYFALVEEQDDIFYLAPHGSPDDELVAIAQKYPSRAIPWMMNTLRTSRTVAKAAKIASIIHEDQPVDAYVGLRLYSLFTQGEEYLRGNVSMDKLALVDEQIKRARVTVGSYHGLCATDQIRQAQQWLELERRYGRWIYGLMEYLVHTGSEKPGEGAQYWGHIFESENNAYLAPEQLLRQRGHVEWYCGDFHCKELLSRAALMAEGDEMHHCVGGYARAVEEGVSRIFSIRHPDKAYWATLDFYSRDGVEWTLNEAATIWNEPPHPDTLAIGLRLAELLNEIPDVPEEAPALESKPEPESEPIAEPQHVGVVHGGILRAVASYVRALYSRL